MWLVGISGNSIASCSTSIIRFFGKPTRLFFEYQASLGDLVSRDDLYATESINVNHCGRNTGFDHLPKLLPHKIYSIS